MIDCNIMCYNGYGDDDYDDDNDDDYDKDDFIFFLSKISIIMNNEIFHIVTIIRYKKITDWYDFVFV